MPELEQITLTAGEKSVDMPVLHPTLGQPCIDIARLPKETGCFTYDPGFGATASCKSAITYIDGDAGVLLYRGYPIEQLAEKSTFTMPAFDWRLSDQEVADVVNFIRTSWGNRGADVNASDVKSMRDSSTHP